MLLGREKELTILKNWLNRQAKSLVVATLLTLIGIGWIIIQTSSVTQAVTACITLGETLKINRFVQIRVVLGIVQTFLSLKGIRLASFAFFTKK